MTQGAASRIQSASAKSGGDMSSSGFAARAQSAAATNANASITAGGHAKGGGVAGSDRKGRPWWWPFPWQREVKPS